MIRKEAPGAWTVVAVLFVLWFLIWGGGANTGAVFFPPVLEHFGWSRATLSTGFAMAALSAGLFGPVVGWMLDRTDARIVMAGGVIVVGLGYIALSRAASFPFFVVCNLVLGLGFVSCTGIPCSLVLANWFTDRRGLAMGISLAGASVGGAAMTPIVNLAIAARGWRFSYVLIAVPMIIVVIPLLMMFVRTRPPSEEAPVDDASGPPPTPIELPGLEVMEALKTRSMWLVTVLQFLNAAMFAGLGQHFIAYLMDVGYTPNVAARVLSLAFVFITIGSLISGPMADRVNARLALAVTWVLMALACVFLLAAAHFSALVAYTVLLGVTGGAFGVLLPLLMLECLGIRRYGSLMGIAGVLSTLGFAAGPIITGWIHDSTGSYITALWLFVALSILSVLFSLACRPLTSVLEEKAAAAAA